MSEFPISGSPEWLHQHKWATQAHESHPIREDIFTEMFDLMDWATHEYDLGVVQAVVDSTDVLEMESVRLIRDQDKLAYYQVTSPVYHRVAYLTNRIYDKRIEVENIRMISDVHTVQFLRDLHGYEGDFGSEEAAVSEQRDRTLANAYNDPSCTEGAIHMDNEPEDGHYGYVDARGLIVQKDSHS